MVPKVVTPIYEIEQKSTKKKLKFRPYLVKEEKILLMAKQSQGDNPSAPAQIGDIFTSIRQIVQSCCLEKKFSAEKLPTFDLEYIFLQLRAFSVNNIETLVVTDNEDGLKYELPLNFHDIDVKFPENPPPKNIDLGNGLSILMKYPSSEIYDGTNQEMLEKLKKGQIFQLVLQTIEGVYNNDIVLKMTKEELEEFLDTLPIPVYAKMKEFLLNMPQLYHRIEYTNSLGKLRYVSFSSIVDFFLFL